MSTPPATPIALRGEFITLAQAVKIAGLAESGGQAKALVREGGFLVNARPEARPGRKLRVGDVIASADGSEWIVTA